MILDFYTRLHRRKLIPGSVYNLPLTQTQIGNYLGLTVVHINRVLRALRQARTVTLEKHCVTIHDLELLRSLAENGEAETVNPRTNVGERSLTQNPLPSQSNPIRTSNSTTLSEPRILIDSDQSGCSQVARFRVGAGVERET
jgi:hypothetical protein